MADIKLKDLTGTTNTYTGKTRIMVDTENGKEIFSQGDAIEAGIIELDFEDGDMELSADNGMLIKSATIKKPDALRPENIAADVVIAGISGTFQGGDGYNVKQIAERTLSGSVEDVNVSFIGSYAFMNQDITMASFPTCQTIYTCGFASCESLSTVNFDTCLTVHNDAFAACSSLTNAYLPLCASAPNGMFYGCANLSSITLDFSNIKHVGDEAFTSTPITSISIPACTSIGSNAFRGCSILSNVYAPSTTSVGSNAFVGCESLQSAQLSTFVGNVYDHAFGGCYNLSDIGELTVRKVFDYAFHECSNITSISFASTYDFIGSNAFYGCSKLSRIYGCIYLADIALDVSKYIGDWAFANCTRLESVTMCFGSASTSALSASYVFAMCSYLSRLTLSSNTEVVPIGSEFFEHSPFLESHMLYERYKVYSYASIYVPSSLYSQFRSAPGWSLVSNRMVRYTPSSST